MNKINTVLIDEQLTSTETRAVGVVQPSNRNEQIQGKLTSRIETKHGKVPNKSYHYGFFKLESQDQEIPVIFKDERDNYKPNLTKGSQVELTGKWANSCLSDRQSFTCSDFKTITGPPELTTKALKEQIQSLLSPSQEKKKEWSQTVDFFFRKLEELKELEKFNQLGEPYLKAHLLLKNARYANYQTEYLEQVNFNQASYLAHLASEIAITKRQMFATGWKEASN